MRGFVKILLVCLIGLAVAEGVAWLRQDVIDWPLFDILLPALSYEDAHPAQELRPA